MRKDKLMIRVNEGEKELLSTVAEAQGLTTASWARLELVRCARAHTAKPNKPIQHNSSDLDLLSLFCGAGGLDQGFREAGFKTRVAIDIDKFAIESFRFNHPEAAAVVRDINALTVRDLDDLADGELEPIGVIGGPPCQSFSVSKVHQSDDDPRHLLAEKYAALLDKLNRRRPISFFLFENVPGLLGARHRHRYENFKLLFEKAGFNVHEAVLNAKNYGVPQDRPRVFIVGINQKRHPHKKWVPPPEEARVLTVRDAIKGLPEPVRNAPGLDPETFPVHANHWCLVPRSEKFRNGLLKQGEMPGRCFRTLPWDQPSWTVAYGHREVHVHPNGIRRLSVYEAMLLQSFPKTYRLKGNMSAQIRLVSEAVPPRLAWHLANSIRACLGI